MSIRDFFRNKRRGRRDKLADVLPVRDPVSKETGEIEADFKSGSIPMAEGETSFTNVPLHQLRAPNDLGLYTGLEVQWQGEWWALKSKAPFDEFDELWQLTAPLQPIAGHRADIRGRDWRGPRHAARLRKRG